MRERPDRADEERQQVRKEIRTEKRVRRSFGRVVAALGILAALMGDLTPGEVGSAGPVGILMGALGYVLGARWLGTIAIVLAVAEILLGVLAR
jgi:hypothetical protein